MGEKLVHTFRRLDADKQSQVTVLYEEFLINPEWSYSSIAEQINEITGMHLNRRSAARLREQLGFPERDITLTKLCKARRGIAAQAPVHESTLESIVDAVLKDHTVQDVESIYQSRSLADTAGYFSTSPHHMRLVLQHLSIPLRPLPPTYYDLIRELQDKGYGREHVEMMYSEKNLPLDDVVSEISSIVERDVTVRQCTKLLDHWGIRRTAEHAKHNRGERSRREMTVNMGLLEKAGFSSKQELADYYEKNKSITKHELISQMNRRLDAHDKKFTIRWLERHMDPVLSEDRLKGVSRVELSLREYIEFIIDSDAHEIVYNTRSLICPYEIDIYIPSLSLGIELNGDYWHSDRFMQENYGMSSYNYHKRKDALCREKETTLLFVWESDWERDRETVKSALSEYFRTGIIDAVLQKYDNEEKTTSERRAYEDLLHHLSQDGFTFQTEHALPVQRNCVYIPENDKAIQLVDPENEEDDKWRRYEEWRACSELGVQLLTVWKDDWLRKKSVVRRMVARKLGASQERKVHARKTSVRTVSSEIARSFYAAHHIQGHRNGHHIALIEGSENAEPVAVMTLNCYGTKVSLERFATSCIVAGGFSKVLSYARRLFADMGCEKMITFADHTVSDGGLYEKNGFVVDEELDPDYMYVVDGERKHKFGYRLRRFERDAELIYESGCSERELAEMNGLSRVWDCGKTRYRLDI